MNNKQASLKKKSKLWGSQKWNKELSVEENVKM